MELTIEQALKQGIAAHRGGKLDDAERLYRAILKSQPLHPDANHNLGVLAVSVNKADTALSLFKTALEANSRVEQFWLSYISTLIKEKLFEDAKAVLSQAREYGVGRDKLNVFETQLTPKTSISEPKLTMQQKSPTFSQKRKQKSDNKKQKVMKHNLKDINPSEEEINNLLQQYHKGQHTEAEKLAQSLTERFPTYQFGWKALGAILGQTGRKSDAINANQKALQLNPQDAEAHSNLGIMLKELGRLDEAEASYRKAIALKSDYAEAHNNLGNILKELGKLDEAEASCRKAIVLKSDYAEAHYNLGITLQELGRLDEVQSSLMQAIALKFDFADAHYNLGVTLQELGRLDEAEASYRQTITLEPDYDDAHRNLLKCLYLLDKKSLFIDELDYLINQDKANALIGSLTCRSNLKYGLEKPNLFCREPLKYILHTDLNTQYDFEEVFVKKARSILKKKTISNRKQSLLVNGYQTSGNLFDIKNSFTEEIQRVIRLEIEKYRFNFKNSKEGLIKKWPTDYSLYGWLISMKSGGELQAHIHDQGWLSGSVYINIPLKSHADSGNLVVSLGEEKDATDTRINMKKIINVDTGSLVLFPASLTHYTIPFEAEEERIVLAFDVKEK